MKKVILPAGAANFQAPSTATHHRHHGLFAMRMGNTRKGSKMKTGMIFSIHVQSNSMADYRTEIQSLLFQLHSRGYTRREIEKDLGYSDNYLDQIISKGGNKKVARALTSYLKMPKKAGPKPAQMLLTTDQAAVMFSEIMRELNMVKDLLLNLGVTKPVTPVTKRVINRRNTKTK